MEEAIKKVFKEQIHNYLTSEQKNLFNNKDKLFDSLLELVFKNGITKYINSFYFL